MIRLGKFLIVCSMCMFMLIPACITEEQINPDTGETRTVTRADPCAVDKIISGGEAGVSILTALSPFFPWLAPIATGVGGVVLTLKQQKPKLVSAQSKQKMYHTVASAAVTAIDNLRSTNPELVANLLKEMEQVKNKLVSPEDVAKIENVIRALRGKPAIEEEA